MPLSTVTPALASPRPSDLATSVPYGEALRAPTTATGSAAANSQESIEASRDVEHRGRRSAELLSRSG